MQIHSCIHTITAMYTLTHIYIYTYIMCACIYTVHTYMKQLYSPTSIPDLGRVSLHLQSTYSSKSGSLRSAITAIPCDPPSCRLQSTNTAKCTLPYCIILKGWDSVPTGSSTPQQACQPSNPDGFKSFTKKNGNRWKRFPYASVCLRMLPYGTMCSHLYQKHMIQHVSCCSKLRQTQNRSNGTSATGLNI